MGILEDKKRARIFYRYFSKIYDYINPIFYSDKMRKTVVDMADIDAESLVLEVGCGTGFTTEEIVRRIGEERVVAVDITPEQMMKARAKMGGVNYFLGDAENLPFKDNSFDAAISAGSIEYWPNPQKGIEEMARVTKNGGKVVILAPRKPDNFAVRKFAESIMLFPSTQQCVYWFMKAGLEDIRFVETGPYRFWSKLVVIISGTVP
ncbi:MAG: Chloroplast inner envelope membrane protein [Archaeoglobus fulgidus]|uniref:Chloroplast inner envelope membrane protein n=1 Tax=Archaeoglobus fulgidus TaxID=2234 RepID=A0A101E227_ARCFL|nr:methyltransferase domain-containing protein [Archaeoglobus fulgidus]KUJ93596.1 MAG: Chloroplast inner envelope membrane protein [Archaeoglobus fulgidus]KUK07143.1 MAG: Chloroplast inner envelope membrane protein [Archaeoglobus fulgidus]